MNIFGLSQKFYVLNAASVEINTVTRNQFVPEKYFSWFQIPKNWWMINLWFSKSHKIPRFHTICVVSSREKLTDVLLEVTRKRGRRQKKESKRHEVSFILSRIYIRNCAFEEWFSRVSSLFLSFWTLVSSFPWYCFKRFWVEKKRK